MKDRHLTILAAFIFIMVSSMLFVSADTGNLSNRTFVDTRNTTNGSNPLVGVPKLIDVLDKSSGRRFISYEMAKQALARPTQGSVTVYLQVQVPDFAGANGGWGATAGGLGTFYGLEMKTFSKIESLDTIQYRVGKYDGKEPGALTPDAEWMPTSFNQVINIPLQKETYYFKIELMLSSAEPKPLTVAARFKSARLCDDSGMPVTKLSLFPDQRLWILSHGKIDGENSFRTMNTAVNDATNSDRVVSLDWASGASGELSDLSNGRYFVNLGDNLAQLLKNEKQRPVNVDWVGHSWGTYIGYETADSFKKVNRFIALDPALLALGGYDHAKINFGSVSNFSTGVKGGGFLAFAGSEKKTKTCDFSIRLYSENAVPSEFVTFYHSLPCAWFIRAIGNTTDPYWNFFGQTLLRLQMKPVMPPRWGTGKLDGFDLECYGITKKIKKSGGVDFLSHEYLLYSPRGVKTKVKAGVGRDGWRYRPAILD